MCRRMGKIRLIYVVNVVYNEYNVEGVAANLDEERCRTVSSFDKTMRFNFPEEPDETM